MYETHMQDSIYCLNSSRCIYLTIKSHNGGTDTNIGNV